MTPSKQQMLTENHKQIERRMPDGRRRITPICVCKPGDFDTPMPFGSLNNFNKHGFASALGFGSQSSDGSIISKTATEQSTIIIEKRDEKDEVVDVSPIKSVIYTKPNNFSTNSNSNDAKVNATAATLSTVQPITFDSQKLTVTMAPTLKSIPEAMDTTSVAQTKENKVVTEQTAVSTQKITIPKPSDALVQQVSLSKPKTSVVRVNSNNESKSSTAITNTSTTPAAAPSTATTHVSAKQTQKPASIVKPSTSGSSAQNSQTKANPPELVSLNNNLKTPVAKLNSPLKSTLSDSQRSQHHFHHGHGIMDAQHFVQYLKPLDVITDKNLIKIVISWWINESFDFIGC